MQPFAPLVRKFGHGLPARPRSYVLIVHPGLWRGLAVGSAASAGRLVVPRLVRW